MLEWRTTPIAYDLEIQNGATQHVVVSTEVLSIPKLVPEVASHSPSENLGVQSPIWRDLRQDDSGDETFYPVSFLTRQLTPLDLDLKVEGSASHSNSNDLALAKLWINRQGIVEVGKLIETNAEKGNEHLFEHALASLRRARFRPGEIRGRPVGVMALFVVEIDGNNIRLRPEGDPK